MSYKDIKGNRPVIERLIQSVKNGSVFHAYIFEGQSGDIKTQLALNFAKAILCDAKTGECCDGCVSCRKADHGNHEDIISITADGASIKDEVVESMQVRLKKKPLAGDRNIAIIDKADTMTLRAQNRLLKTLEEPSGGNVIILLSENAGNLTATIRSRCIIHRINTGSASLMNEGTDDRAGLLDIAQGILEGKPLYELVPLLSELGRSKEESLELLDILETWFRDLLLICCGSSGDVANERYRELLEREARLHRPAEFAGIIKNIEKARKDLNMNITSGYALRSMLLGIQEDKDDKSCRHQV